MNNFFGKNWRVDPSKWAVKPNIWLSGKLSKQEALKTSRDIVIITIVPLFVSLLEVLASTDFWDLTFMISTLTWALITYLNRKYNLVRVEWDKIKILDSWSKSFTEFRFFNNQIEEQKKNSNSAELNLESK